MKTNREKLEAMVELCASLVETVDTNSLLILLGADYEEKIQQIRADVFDVIDAVPEPKEKRVWINMNNGQFSNSWKPSDPVVYVADEELAAHANAVEGWHLIKYEILTDAPFEFSQLMKIVSTTREERKRK